MKFKTMSSITLITLITLFSQTEASEKKSLTWNIQNPAWTSSFEKSYEEFVATLGKARAAKICHGVNDCLKNPKSNPKFFNFNPKELGTLSADCGKFPYILRAYFSWMNGLPFSYPTALSAVNSVQKNLVDEDFIDEDFDSEDLSYEVFDQSRKGPSIGPKGFFGRLRRGGRGGRGGGADIRYNRLGNTIDAKKIVKTGDNINSVLADIGNFVLTAVYRTNASNNTTGTLFRDIYPVKISREAIKPGTILYDPNGHVAVVYDVASNGKIHLVDAHPDNSLTTITYGEKFSRTSVNVAGGFSNWRPFSVQGGVVQAASNESLPAYSLEQFASGTVFVFKGKSMSFYEYVRNSLTIGTLVYKPVQELTEILEEVCHDVMERKDAVDVSLTAGIQNQSHPSVLPSNIYGTDGDWETYSSPSRDARLKASIREGKNLVLKMITGYKNTDPSIQYEGQDLIGDLLNAYNDSTSKCSLAIKKSNGSSVNFNLNDFLTNIYKVSFDPYHCNELRWGLTDNESLSSCGKDKFEWYKAEQGLRNKIDRDYSVKTNYTLSELPGAPVSGTIEEDISILNAIRD